MKAPASSREEAAELRREINRHNYQYHVLDAPLITDQDYDRLFRRLQQLEDQYPELLTPDSPTQRVGSEPASHFETVEHEVAMLSLENAFESDELLAFDKRLRDKLDRDDALAYSGEPKLDGLAVSLLYEGGELVRAATRGDGQVGEDVTANVQHIADIPQLIAGAPDVFEARGEVYMAREDFRALNTRLMEEARVAAEERGGEGGTLVEWAIVLRELGRAACPGPVVEQLTATRFLLAEERAAQIAAGSHVVSLGVQDQPGDPTVWAALHPEHGDDFGELVTRTVSHTVQEPAYLCPASIAIPRGGFQLENLAVQVPGADIVFLGALGWFGSVPLGFEADFDVWIETLETALDWGSVFVPGHGPVGDARDVRSLISYLDAVRQAAATGAGLADGPWSQWAAPHHHEINVERAAMLASGDRSPPPSMMRLLGRD